MVEYLPRSEWTDEPSGFATCDGTDGREDRTLDPQRIEWVALRYPDDGPGVRHADLDIAGTRQLLNAYREWHVDGRGWADIGYPCAVDQAGRVWELAGDEYAAAHSTTTPYPDADFEGMAILLVLGDDEEPTPEMIGAIIDRIDTWRRGRFPNLGTIIDDRDGRGFDSPGGRVAGPEGGTPLERGLPPAEGRVRPTAVVSPIKGRVSSEYGTRIHPVSKVKSVHRGIDIAAPEGTPVLAAFGGVVRAVRTDSWRGDTRGNPVTGSRNTGNFVLIDGPGGGSEWYGHFSRCDVRPGQHVSAGEVIGLCGQTGNVTGPHLHLETWASRECQTHRNPRRVFEKYGLVPGAKPVPPPAPPPAPVPVPVKHTVSGPDTERIRQRQKALAAMGFYTGAIDGDAGGWWARGVNAYIRAQLYKPRLVADGAWGPACEAHYEWVRALQRAMNGWKGDDVPVDGDYRARTSGRVRDVMVRNKGGAYRGAVDGDPGRTFCAMLGIPPHPGL